jgi:hypothetical protein
MRKPPMRFMAAWFALFFNFVQAQQVLRVPLTESKHAVRATTSYGEPLLPLVRVQLEIRGGKAKNSVGDLVVVYDPQTGHYFWRYRPVHTTDLAESFVSSIMAGTFAIYSGLNGIVEFQNLGALFVQEHTESANSLEAAQAASIDALQRGLPAFAGNGYDQGLKEVVYLRPTDSAFSCPDTADPNSYCKRIDATVASLARVGENWRVVMRGSWDQEVILDPKFNVVSMRRLPEAVQQHP